MTAHSKPLENVLQELETDWSHGLGPEQVAARFARYGPNRLRQAKKKTNIQRFFDQFRDMMILILLAAAAVSFVLACMEGVPGAFFEPALILIIVILNAMMGVIQESRAEKALEALKSLSAPQARVLRGGREAMIPAAELVPGDIIRLEAGDFVPADARLLHSASLKSEESALTGESVPAEKDATLILEENTPLGDRVNMVFSGCSISYGTASAVVTATGMDTEMGKIAHLLESEEQVRTPLQQKLAQLGRYLGLLALAACGVIFLVGLANGLPVIEIFMTAVSLAVSAIPEGLPAIVTIVLSLGVHRLVKKHAIIRQLPAVETLGSASVICSDKTGTLTQNRMTVRKLYTAGRVMDASDADFSDPIQEPLLRSALLCSDATVDENGEVGDPTETALVRLGEDHGFDEEAARARWPRLTEIPFDSDRKLMSTVHQMEGGRLMVTKGAVDVLLDRCILSPAERTAAEQANEAFSKEGLRVLAFACRPIDRASVSLEDENGLDFLGLIAMMDPPRVESKRAVAACIAAGIRPVMITGDHKVTAAAIAKEIGILTDDTLAVEGTVLDGMSEGELKDYVPRVSVYARVTPEHKIRIVRAWQARGALVAMTGDGVNDAPALKQADIGVAMGVTGTEVAKDAAGMVLADDNFATIVQAVKNGRNVYANIKKAIQFLLSGNMAGILTVLYASLMGLPVPFAAVHLLFINLLTDSLPAIALGLEPHRDEVMGEKPRPRDEGILTRSFLTSVGVEGLVIALAAIAAFHTGLRHGEAVGSTMAFATLCLSRLFHGFNCKAERPVLLTKQFWDNRWLLGAFAAGAALLGAVLLVPTLEPLFRVTKLSAGLLAAVVGLSAGSMLVIQLLKALCARKQAADPH